MILDKFHLSEQLGQIKEMDITVILAHCKYDGYPEGLGEGDGEWRIQNFLEFI